MSIYPNAPPPAYTPRFYWEQRARRFAGVGGGLAAVCSYGMPAFYNWTTHLEQRLALARWLKVGPGTRVLDAGCGIGRWSQMLAARGATVTGVDLSPTMIELARRRVEARALAGRCRFLVQDLSSLDTGQWFDLVLVVTVMQHILQPDSLISAMRRLAAQLAPTGKMIVLEASPNRGFERCESSVFTARSRLTYLRMFDSVGLRVRAMTGVDPAPFKTRLLPYLQQRRPLAIAALAAATAAAFPINLVLGRLVVKSSWHTVFVLEHARGDRHAAPT